MSNQSTYDPSEGELSVDREDFHHAKEQIAQALDWRRGLWAVLDVERTGLGADDKIVQIAIITMRDGKLLSQWSSLINPCVSIPLESTAIHGIVDADVAEAPRIEDVRDEIVRRLTDVSAVVAYNGISADFPWLDWELPGVIKAGPVYYDPLVVARTKPRGPKNAAGSYATRCVMEVTGAKSGTFSVKRQGKNSLGNMMQALDIELPGARWHSAETDAIAAGLIGIRLVNECNADGQAHKHWQREAHKFQTQKLAAWAKTCEARDAQERSAREDVVQRLNACIVSFEERIGGIEAKIDGMACAADSRVRDLEDEKASLTKRLDEVETYAAKLEAALGKSPFAGGVG